MNRIWLLSSAALIGVSPLSAAVVVADFNDLNLGGLRSGDGQPGDSGTGFGDAFWSTNTGVPRIVAGNLTAPAATNYAVIQSGNARSFQSTSYTIADATDRRQARTVAVPLTGVVWFSFLVNNSAADRTAGIDFNTATSNLGTAIGSRIVIEGTTLRVLNATNVESASIPSAVMLGQTALVVGRIEIGTSPVTAGNDIVNLWINPALDGNSSNLGAAIWGSNNTNFLGSASSISILGLQSYSTLTGSGQNGGVLDGVRFSDGVNGYYDVTGISSIPEPSSFAALAGAAVLIGAGLSRRR